MRKLFLSVLSLSALCASAVTIDVARLPAPSHADREVSGDAAMPATRLDNMRTFRLELTFNASPSNNVQVAFGRDAMPADGKLAAEETDYIIGYDCGEWFLRPQGLSERYAFPSAVTNGQTTLNASVRVNAQGVPQSAVFADGTETFTFDGLALAPCPDWLNPGLWTCLRVTVRGADTAEESICSPEDC
jgi:hypothetical protein